MKKKCQFYSQTKTNSNVSDWLFFLLENPNMYSIPKSQQKSFTYLQNFNYTLITTLNINCFKHFTIFASAKLPYELIIILLSARIKQNIIHVNFIQTDKNNVIFTLLSQSLTLRPFRTGWQKKLKIQVSQTVWQT